MDAPLSEPGPLPALTDPSAEPGPSPGSAGRRSTLLAAPADRAPEPAPLLAARDPGPHPLPAATRREAEPSLLPLLSERAAQAGLLVAGVAPLLPEDGLPGFRSAVLLAPDEPGFWPLFRSSPEARDGRPDPLDRWSRRVVGRLACEFGTKAAFPFGGPPWRPFTAWARRSGRAWESPVGLLVHDTLGLWISFRGAVLLREGAPPAAALRPCDACPAPCLSACPPRALTGSGYDLPACHAFLDSGPDCLEGCRVRRACPVGQGRRDPAQSAFHMRSFHPAPPSRRADKEPVPR